MSPVAMELTKGSADTHELLQAQAHIWNHLLQTICNVSLKCAVELGIPDIINNHGRPMTHSELVEALPVPTTRAGDVHRLMRLLVHSGFFAVQKNEDGEGYVLTPSSKLLLSGSKMSQLPFLLMLLNSEFTSPWHFLGKWFQGKDASVMETATGMAVWEFMAKNPEAADMFNKAMASDSSILMEVLVNECGAVFQGVGSLVDVGGGTGLSATTISGKFPHIKCTVLDLPHVVAAAPLKTSDLDFVGGDMFESIPKADALFLKAQRPLKEITDHKPWATCSQGKKSSVGNFWSHVVPSGQSRIVERNVQRPIMYRRAARFCMKVSGRFVAPGNVYFKNYSNQ